MATDIATLLAEIKLPGSFAARRTSNADDLHLEVRGIGRIELPISRGTARELCARSRPAGYGFKSETRHDARVRDTWEITKDQIRIDERRFANTLDPTLERIGRSLGVGRGARLRAELYNLLVYEPGQFFVAHQDSEKGDGMIGTLIVTLPSPFEGGAMVVHHHQDKKIFRETGEELSYIAFYADCHHEVKPVTSGFRVVLTYNLFREGDATDHIADPDDINDLAIAIREHFERPVGREAPDRLIYLLDHQYTQKGLSWRALKNGDASRAASLVAVAERLDCEIFLALADVHEVWSCEDEYWNGRGRRVSYSDDDQDDDTTTAETPALDDLIDSSIELRHWVGRTGTKAEAISGWIAPEEICFTKATVELEPFQSEHEGYMGNYGNTVERWYHRAAIVLWPRERTFVIRARASAAWALDQMKKAIVRRATEEARSMVSRVLPFWPRSLGSEERPRLLDRALAVSAAIEDPVLASQLLHPFALDHLSSKSAPRIEALLQRYGLRWCLALLESWISRDRDGFADFRAGHERWVASMPELIGPLSISVHPGAPELARWLVGDQWAWLAHEHRGLSEYAAPSVQTSGLNALNPAILGLLESCLITGAPERSEEILRFIVAEDGHPIECLADLLMTAHESYPSDGLAPLGLEAVYADCRKRLGEALAAPSRNADDWSIRTPKSCSCELCAELSEFLSDARRIRFDWPLNKERRGHIHSKIDQHELPVSHETLRRGSPQTLVLVKTRALFQREAELRRTWTDALRRLQTAEADFQPPRSEGRRGKKPRELRARRSPGP